MTTPHRAEAWTSGRFLRKVTVTEVTQNFPYIHIHKINNYFIIFLLSLLEKMCNRVTYYKYTVKSA